MTRLFTLQYSNKENEPQKHRKVTENPYVTRKKVPTATATQASNSKQAPSSATTKRKSSSTIATTQSLDTIEEEEETSPTIRRILEKTGC